MTVSGNTKYIYRDIATGRLIHRRQAEQRPADSWSKEVFKPPADLESPFASNRSTTLPMMEGETDDH